MPFKERLKILREAAGLTQVQLADALGCSQQKVDHWESGRNKGPKPDELFRLCEALGVDCSAFQDSPPKRKK